MSEVVLEERAVIPDGIRNYESYRQWARSPEFPQTGRFAFSTSFVKKDTVDLRERYWKVGVQEYWLINALEDELQFDILRRTRSRYVASRKRAGWVESKVFGKSFKLTSKPDELGYPEYTLLVR